MSRCRSCGAPIIWAVTKSGRSMPLDEATDPAGNVLLLENGNCLVPAPEDDVWEAAGGTRHTSHFATCPNADQHRRR